VHLCASARPGRVHADARLHFHAIDVPAYPLFEHAPYSLAVAGTLVDVARAHRLDLVQVHYAVPHAVSAMLARQVLGSGAPRVVTSLHGTDVTRVGVDPSYRSVTAFAVAASDGITTPSIALREQARRALAIPADKPIDVLPNFVDTDAFAPVARRDRSRLHALFARPPATPDAPVLFHVSNLRAVKRVGDLFEVLARVRRRVPARLVVVGDGPERAAAEARAAELGLTAEVCFLGRRADFVEYLAHADAFVLPSESESFGVAALEAMSAGVPVVAYRVGGLPEVVAPEAGRLVAPYDVDALAHAVLDVIGDTAAHEAIARAARAHVLAHFAREPAITRYEAYFRRLVGDVTP
jgi:N-acetyl-alpha-D-glucosaminyl L-malate synthase BshA